ncbi:MAG: hypothetical protein ABSG25_11020 [Bryobacteraceae bacterium]
MARDEFDHNVSMDKVERVMAIEGMLNERIIFDSSLSTTERERLIRELEDLVANGEFPEGDDWDKDDALGIPVRKLGPRGPAGSLGAAVRPETDNAEVIEEGPQQRGLPNPDEPPSQ